MYTVTLSGLVLHRYGAACGWGPYSSTTGEPGNPVTFNSRADAQAWIDARPVFALGAVPSQSDTETISTVPTYTGTVTVTHDGNGFEWSHRDDDGRVTLESRAGYGSAGSAMLAALVASDDMGTSEALRTLANAYAPDDGNPVSLVPYADADSRRISRAWAILRDYLHHLDQATR